MSETTSNKTVPAKKAADKKVATTANGVQLFVSPTVSAIFWTIAFLIEGAVIFGNYYYTTNNVSESNLARLIRVLIVILGFVIAFVVALLTNKGRTLVQFARQSYTELKKVVWPTRQEAVQTTFIVFVAVCIVSLFLYLCDIVFLQVVRLFTL